MSRHAIVFAVIIALLFCSRALSQAASSSSPSAVTITAMPGEAINRLTAVVLTNGLAYRANPLDATQSGKVAGIAISASDVGLGPITIQVAGEVPAYGLTAGNKYYVGSNGALSTATMPIGAAWGKYLGYARSDTLLEIQPNEIPVGLSTTDIVTVTGSLTSAQIKALHATPVAVIAAQGANTLIDIVRYSIKYLYGGTAYTSATGKIILSYGTPAYDPSPGSDIFTNAGLIGASTLWAQGTGTELNSSSVNNENLAVNLYNSAPNELATGNGTIEYNIDYRIVQF